MGTGPSCNVDAIRNKPRFQWRRTTETSHQEETVNVSQDAEEHQVLWTDALAALHIELEELKRQARVSRRETGVQTKVEELLRINPHHKQAQGNLTTDPLPIRVDNLTNSSNLPTRHPSRRAGSFQIDEPAEIETKVPKRSGSLGKSQEGRSVGSRNGDSRPPKTAPVDVKTSKNAPPKTVEISSVQNSTTIRQTIRNNCALARITTGTYTCASPSGTTVTPIENPYDPYKIARKDTCPAPTVSADTVTTAGTRIRTSGSDEPSTHHLPREVVTNSSWKGKHSHVRTSTPSLANLEPSANRRHKYDQRSRRHLHTTSVSGATSLPVEGTTEGKNEAKSHVPSDIGENSSHRSIFRHCTSAHKNTSRNRQVKVPRTVCPPEIFCALVCLDGPVLYTQDT